MASNEPFVTYLEQRESTAEGDAGAGLSHTSAGLVLLHVLELAAHGEPRGAVTFVHDAGDHGGRYLPLARGLAESGWAVALPDLRGHGQSEGERGHSAGIPEVVRDLGDVQDHLAYRQPEAPRVLAGQGLGALWCLAFACERPEGVAALVLCAPLLEPRFQLPAAASGMLRLFRKIGPATPGRIGWTPEQLTSLPAEAAARAADPRVHDVITLRAGSEAAEAARRYSARLPELRMPVLVLHGAEDPIARADSASKLARANVRVEVLAGRRHDLFHDVRAEETVQRLVSWLDEALPRA